YTTDDQVLPAVATDPSGNFVVVWEGLLGVGDPDIFAQRYARSGTPLGTEFRVNTYAAAFQQTPSIAADSSGNFVVVWRSLDQHHPANLDSGRVVCDGPSPTGSVEVAR